MKQLQDNQQIENISDKEINKEEKILTNDEQSDSLKKDNYREKVKSSFGIKRYKIQEVIKPDKLF